MENYKSSHRAISDEAGYQPAFYHHHEQKGKGNHRLHNPVHCIDVPYNGHCQRIDKRQKPEGVTLTGWIMNELRCSENKAKDIARMFQ